MSKNCAIVFGTPPSTVKFSNMLLIWTLDTEDFIVFLISKIKNYIKILKIIISKSFHHNECKTYEYEKEDDCLPSTSTDRGHDSRSVRRHS